MLSKADRLLGGKEIELELPGVKINLESVKYKIAKTVSTYYDNEYEEKTKELFEEMLPEILTKLGLKREINNQKIGVGTRLKHKFNF
jgi:predicted sugar kinase